MIKNIILNLSIVTLSFSSSVFAQSQEQVSALQNKINEFSSTGNSKVHAHIANSKVVLSGVVSSQEFKTKLLREVMEMPGIQDVIDEVTVDPTFGKEMHSDQEIHDSISRELSSLQIPYSNLVVNKGVVSISLDLASFQKVDEVLAKIRGIPGVMDLKSDAKVNGAPYLKSVDKNY